MRSPLSRDARETIVELGEAVQDWKADAAWTERGRVEFARWNSMLDGFQRPTNDPIPTYAQVVGVVNAKAGERDLLITAAGGLPGEVMKNWRVKAPNTFDCEFGFSCMGYEIAAGWGAAMADPTRTPIVMIGDGTYMMMNSDIYSSVLAGHKMIIVVCDNGGYAVINRLQNAKGGASFNNLIRDCRVKEPFAVDFAKHAEAMGALDATRREPRGSRPGGGMGEDHRPHDRHHHRLRRLHLDAWRRVVGCRRAAGQQPRRGDRGIQSTVGWSQAPARRRLTLHPGQDLTAASGDNDESQVGNCAHRLVQ